MSFDSEVLADSPVAYLKLGEASGTTAADSSGNSHTGTYHNCTVNQTGLITGESEKSVLFDGTTSYIDMGNPAALQIVGQYAIEAIIKTTFPTSGGNVQLWIAGKGYDGTNENLFRFFLNPDGGTKEIHAGVYRGSDNIEYDAKQAITWAVDETHIVAAQFTGSAWEIYVDGFLLKSSTTSVGQLASGSNFVIGAEDVGSIANFFKGHIEKVSIYNTSLASGRWLAHAVAAGFASGAINITSATVPTTGEKVNLVFNFSLGGIVVEDFQVVADGKPVKIASLTGSGTAWVLHLDEGWIIAGQAVVVSYLGAVIDAQSVNGTNNSTVTLNQSRYGARRFAAFIHFSTATWQYDYLPDGPTQAAINGFFNPTGYDMDQWLDTVQAAGVDHVVLTTKHDAGFCLWPTLSGTVNIGATPWFTSTGIDIVAQFTSKARARGLGVGLYINFYDPWFKLSRAGATGTYPAVAFTAYMVQQITELLTNYGKIDSLWTDSWAYDAAIGYTNANYTTIRALITSLQPACVLVNNTHTGANDHTEIVEYEGPGMSIPSSSNVAPSEFCETATLDGDWVWNPTNDGACIDPLLAASHLKECQKARCNYLLNFPPNQSGLMPTSTVAFAEALGALVGLQGDKLFPLAPPDVKSGVDRGDGVIGTAAGGGGGGGINGTGILGMT